MTRRRRLVIRSFLALAMMTGAFAPAVAARPARVVILKSRNLEPFNQAVAGFRSGLAGAAPEIVEFNAASGSDVIARIAQFNPDLIGTFGSTATTLAREQFGKVPVVFAMVLYPSASGIDTSSRTGNLTGVAMDIPILTQFETIRAVLPEARRVGVIYDPKQTGFLIAQARQVARSTGMELVAVSVSSEREVPAALQGLERKIDVLWSVADNTVFTPTTTQFVIVYTLQHELPFMGLSVGFAEGGALFALGQDYGDMGREAAEAALRIMDGTPAATIPVIVPRKTELVVNLRVAGEIKVTIPAATLNKAARVIR